MSDAPREMWAMLWPDARLDLPAEAVEALGIEGGWQCKVEVTDGAIVIRPSDAIPEEDLWAYTREHIESIKGARASRVGYQLSPRQLRRISRLFPRHEVAAALRIVLRDNLARQTIMIEED